MELSVNESTTPSVLPGAPSGHLRPRHRAGEGTDEARVRLDTPPVTTAAPTDGALPSGVSTETAQKLEED